MSKQVEKIKELDPLSANRLVLAVARRPSRSSMHVANIQLVSVSKCW